MELTKKTERKSRYKKDLLEYTKKNNTVIILGITFIAGVMLGSCILNMAGSEVLELVLSLNRDFLSSRQDNSFAANFYSALVSSAVFVVPLFLLGFCAIAQPAEVLTPFFKGLGVGLSVSSIYYVNGFKAAWFIAVYILIPTVLNAVIVIICAKESLRMSRGFLSCIDKENAAVYPLKLYLARYFVAFAACFVSAFIEALNFLVFKSYISL